jgi:hypothetical protein
MYGSPPYLCKDTFVSSDATYFLNELMGDRHADLFHFTGLEINDNHFFRFEFS